MDSITHGLTGLVFGMLHKKSQENPELHSAVIAASVAAAEAPDIDVMYRPGGDLGSLKYHRGITHSLPGTLGLALFVSALVKLIYPKAKFAVLYRWSLASLLLTHIALDLPTSYGTQVLLPWSKKRWSWDLLSTFDPFILIPLILALALGWKKRLLLQKAAVTALCFLLFYITARGVSHQIVKTTVLSRWPQSPVTLSILPGNFGLNTWRYVAEFPGQYELGQVSLTHGIKPEAVLEINPYDAVTLAALQDDRAQAFLEFARHPYITCEQERGNTTVKIVDLRYNRGDVFSARIELGPELRVINAWVRSRPERSKQ